MNKITNYFRLLFSSLFLIAFLNVQAQDVNTSPRKVINFDSNWRFIQKDVTGAQVNSYNDSGWRQLNVPHDWSIEGTYNQNNPTGHGGGYLPAGIGWYRKTFTLDTSLSHDKFFIEFDGVMANSDVWINGYHLGKRPYGYSSFSYEMTGHLNFGNDQPNVLAVRVDDSLQPASRFYTGAGIYRHVRLVETSPVHISHWGEYIRTTKISDNVATLNVQTNVKNESSLPASISLHTSIVDPSGVVVKTAESTQVIPADSSININQPVDVSDPVLWDIDNPELYKAITKVVAQNATLDEESTTFGIRESKFEAATGYWLNGKNIKIKGVCMHHDCGALGSAVPLSAWKRRLELLKQVGVNAIRTSHNPVAPEFLDLCDRMGFLVMDETFDTWDAVKSGATYGYNLYFDKWWEPDTRNMVMRDRNHPSIIIYSVGNEIRDNLNDSAGFRKYREQQNLVHQLDPSRPVTMALFRPGSSNVYLNGFANMMDVVGQNYRESELVQAHLDHPNWKVIGTENGHQLNEWLVLRDSTFMAGQFIWVGFDYLGEAEWPQIAYNQGLFDKTGGWTPYGLQRQSWWSDKPVVNIVRKSDNNGVGNWVADWSPIDPDTYDNASVEIYSNCDNVELFLNGKSLGSKPKPANDAPRDWNVTFNPGTLKAVGSNNGVVVATEELKTAGTPYAVKLSTNKNILADDWDDVSYVTAQVVDKNGIVCPYADKLITFSVDGPGKIVAVDNGNVMSHESYRGTQRYTYNGNCIAIVRANSTSGMITVSGSTPELKSDSVEINVSDSLATEVANIKVGNTEYVYAHGSREIGVYSKNATNDKVFVSIYNELGQKVTGRQLKETRSYLNVPDSGLYLVKVYTNGVSKTNKIFIN